MIALRQTLLPVPVRPAINRCGSVDRSTVNGFPETSLPRKMGIRILLTRPSTSSITSRSRTICRVSLGTSIPTVFLPGMGATIRTLGTRSAIARSSASPVILESRRPASSCTSYWAITGPVSISTTLTLKPKSANVFSRVRALRRTSCSCSSKQMSSDSLSSLISGSSYCWGASLCTASLRRSMTSSRSLLSRRWRIRSGGPVLLASLLDSGPPDCLAVGSWPLCSPSDLRASLRSLARNFRLFRTFRWPESRLEIAMSAAATSSLSSVKSLSAVAKVSNATDSFSVTAFARRCGPQWIASRTVLRANSSNV